MPFGGGGGGDLPNHEHSPAVPLDGGPLDMNNVTGASLNQGSITYSDGANLQELIKPAVPAGEVLQFAALATAPSWGTAGGASFANQTQDLAATFSTSSTGYVTVTGLTHTGTLTSGYSNVTFTGSVSANDPGHVIQGRITKDGTVIQNAIYEGTGSTPQGNYKNFTQTYWVTSDTVDYDFDVLISNGLYIMYVQGGTTGSSFNLMELA